MDLPVWAIRFLPNVWLVVVGLGACLLVYGLWRWRLRSRRACPRCGYDMRGTEGLTCSECGATAAHERQLWRRPIRRWAVAVGLALVVLGPYLDLALFRFRVMREPLPTALMPTTVLIVGYGVFGDWGRDRVDHRLGQWGLAGRGPRSLAYHLPPRSDVWRLLNGGNWYHGGTAMFDWHWQRLGRNSFAWLDAQRIPGQPVDPTTAARVLNYVSIAGGEGDAEWASQVLIDGLTDEDDAIRSEAYRHIGYIARWGLSDAQVDHMEALLRSELAAPNPPQPSKVMVLFGSPPPGTGEPIYQSRRRPKSWRPLEQAIGQSHGRGVEVARRLLREPDEATRYSGIRVLNHAGHYYHDTAWSIPWDDGLVEAVVEAAMAVPIDAWVHQLLAYCGTGACVPIRDHLAGETPSERLKALKVLGASTIDAMYARREFARNFVGVESTHAMWLAFRSEAEATGLTAELQRMAEEDSSVEVRAAAARYLDIAGLLDQSSAWEDGGSIGSGRSYWLYVRDPTQPVEMQIQSTP
ncbi:MAG: hypothetical protein AAF823_14885 [Planctomycetota bacterium]